MVQSLGLEDKIAIRRDVGLHRRLNSTQADTEAEKGGQFNNGPKIISDGNKHSDLLVISCGLLGH